LNYVCSTELNYSFSQSSNTIPEDDYEAANIYEFYRRAYAHPTTDSFAKIIIMISPCSLTTLASYPAY